MNVLNIQYTLRHRSLTEIMDLALLVIRQRPLYTLTLGFFLAITLSVINTLIIFMYKKYDPYEGSLFYDLFMYIVMFIEMLFFTFSFTLLHGRMLFEKKPLLKPILKEGVGCFVPYITYMLPETIKKSIALPLMMFPGIARMFAEGFFSHEVLLLEKIKRPEVKNRASRMVKDHPERIIGFYLINFVVLTCYMIFTIVAWHTLSIQLKVSELHPFLSAGSFLLSPITHLLIFLYSIFYSTARFLLYVDYRSKYEAWDVQLNLMRGVIKTDQDSARNV